MHEIAELIRIVVRMDAVRRTTRGLVPQLLKASGGAAIAVAMLSPVEARAGDCNANPTPACHLAEGKKLIKSDPKRAAAELLASYKLDERTDTLELYAAALENDKQYALAAETWERIVKYRESELTAAKESRAGAAKLGAAQRKIDGAAKAVGKLEATTAKVRIKLNPGPPPKVTRDGTEVDVTKEVWVKAGSDELVFAFADGRTEKVTVVLKPGDNVRIDAPLPKPVEPVEPPRPPEPPPVDKPDPAPAPPIVAMRPPEDKPITRPMPAGPTDQPSNTKRNVGYALIGGGVVLAGVATTFGILARSKFDDAKAAGCSDDGECPVGSRALELARDSNDRARVAQLTGIGAAALIGTGVTLWMLHRKETRRSRMTIHVSGKSASFGWRF